MTASSTEQTQVATTQIPPSIPPSLPPDISVVQRQESPQTNMSPSQSGESPALYQVVNGSTNPDPDTQSIPSLDQASPSDSSFDDALIASTQEKSNTLAQPAQNTIGGEDDYAMTFENDDDNTSEQDELKSDKQPDDPLTVCATTSPPEAATPIIVTDVTQLPPVQEHSMPEILKESSTSFIPPVELNAQTRPIIATPTSLEAHTTQTLPQVQPMLGEIDIQRLLDNITANADSKSADAHNTTPSVISPTSSLPAHASLPPRPQITQQPARASISYQIPKPSDPTITSPVAAAPGRNGLLPPPPGAYTGPALPIPPPHGQNPAMRPPGTSSDVPLMRAADASEDLAEEDRPWPPEVQRLYDGFLADERGYVTEGAWDKFPAGSRLFIGNLPSEKVTKRDLFHIFHKYGRLAQISIKQAYGFIQYHDAASCRQALEKEQDQQVRGRKMHLEISKAQRNTRNAQNQNAKRSRSPVDQGRGGLGGRSARSGSGDHYSGRQNGREDRRGGRDDYRPARSPSPRGIYSGRDGYGRDSAYDSRDRRRSRSRSPPYGHRDHMRYRERSPSPRSREAREDAELQLPRRSAHNIPDVQILLLEEVDRNFVAWVENELRSRGVKSEAIFISARLPLEAVIRRQILEGVHAVSLLTLRSQSASKIPLQVFDRQAGAANVRFDEYQDLEPRIAAELVNRAKQTSARPEPTYSHPQYQQHYQPPPQNNPALPDLTSLVGSLDNNALQQLLGTLGAAAPPQQNIPAAAANPSIDLAGILGSIRGAQQAQAPPGQPLQSSYQQPPAALYTQQVAAGSYQNPSVHSGQAPQSAQQVQDIMAQLAQFSQ